MFFLEVIGVAATTISLVSGWLLFSIIYYVKLPFFEKYKALDDPWPWETDLEGWQRLKLRSFKFSAFNLFLMTATMNLLPYFWG